MFPGLGTRTVSRLQARIQANLFQSCRDDEDGESSQSVSEVCVLDAS